MVLYTLKNALFLIAGLSFCTTCLSDYNDIYVVDIPPPVVYHPPAFLKNSTNYTAAVAAHRRRYLQQTIGTGISGNICSAGNLGRFTCDIMTEMNSTDGNVTRLNMQFDCILDSFIGFDWRKAEDCRCTARASQINRTTRICRCVGCPMDFQSPIAFDCSENEEDPYLVETCVSFDCNGACNGSISFLNAPTPAPYDPNAEGAAAGEGGTGGSSSDGFFMRPTFFGSLTSTLLALFLGMMLREF